MSECDDCKKKAKIFATAGVLLGIAVGAGIFLMVNKHGK